MSGAKSFIGSTETHLPPVDPDDWGEMVYCVQTNHPCPRCGVAVGLTTGNDIIDIAQQQAGQYGLILSENWADGYDTPVYLYCDRPACDYHASAEWADIRKVLLEWTRQDAPVWEDAKN